ncbi:aminopeptidase [Thermodesulfobacteriota bacterium]
MAPLESDSISTLVRKVYVACVAISFLFCSGCGAAYIFQAASGQFSLLNNSIKIEKALKTDSLDDGIKLKLQLVSEIKKFGEERLGLRKTDSYEKVYLKSGRSPIYVLSACPKDSLKRKTWWFPIVGNMPYLGFFDQKKAEKKKNKLKNEDMDVIMRTAGAYSTLGWFDDPVTLNLLAGSTVDLVETILHEMTHTTLYIKGNGEFNEGLANLVGKIGAISFFRNKYGTAHPFTFEAENNLFDELLFSGYINSLIDDLIEIYSSDLSYQHKIRQREEIFRAYHEKHSKSKGEYKTERFKYFGTHDFNNAYILSIALYRREFPKFYKMLEENNNSVRSLLKNLKRNK